MSHLVITHRDNDCITMMILETFDQNLFILTYKFIVSLLVKQYLK